jgi:hypothetical protein
MRMGLANQKEQKSREENRHTLLRCLTRQATNGPPAEAHSTVTDLARFLG